MASMEPCWLSEEQAEALGDLMAAAFFTAPGLSFMFPNPARRKRLVPPFFAAMARLAVRCGEARALGEPLHAVALWMSPGREHPTQAEVAEAGMGAAVALLDAGEAGRLKVFRGHFDATHERVMDRPHWYLSFLAVAPEYQGHGAGTVLMRHLLGRIADTGVPCYLESVDEANLPFYERLGLRVAEVGTVPGTELRTWALRRD
jgi:ribosomal protein S18 acetylase RimI-like enzyme